MLVQLFGGHARAVVCDRELAHAAAGGVESLPVEVPNDPAAGVVGERGDRVQAVDGQLAQASKVRAFAAEALEHYLGAGCVNTQDCWGCTSVTCQLCCRAALSNGGAGGGEGE